METRTLLSGLLERWAMVGHGTQTCLTPEATTVVFPPNLGGGDWRLATTSYSIRQLHSGRPHLIPTMQAFVGCWGSMISFHSTPRTHPFRLGVTSGV